MIFSLKAIMDPMNTVSMVRHIQTVWTQVPRRISAPTQ